MRWLYHVVAADVTLGDPFSPPNFVQDGYIHCSFRDRAAESARLYFAADAPLRVLQIDPRLVCCEVRVVDTPRGPMPHLHGPIPRAAVARELTIDQLAAAPDEIAG
ncbi:MAG: DUF952 domain-containing protein [Myxococcales bacterium]|nr:DUF952 domain-containing protein [Myxococcales bacterium]